MSLLNVFEYSMLFFFIKMDTKDIEMTDSSATGDRQTSEFRGNLLLTGSLLPQRKYLSNRTGLFLSQKQDASNRVKRKDLELDEEQLSSMKKLKVDQ